MKRRFSFKFPFNQVYSSCDGHKTHLFPCRVIATVIYRRWDAVNTRMENVNNETIELNRIIEKYSDQVNTRKNDPISSARRRRAWERICLEYNQLPGVRPRTILQIRRYIHGRRYRSRKHSIDEREIRINDLNGRTESDGNHLTDSDNETDECVSGNDNYDETAATQDELTGFASGKQRKIDSRTSITWVPFSNSHRFVQEKARRQSNASRETQRFNAETRKTSSQTTWTSIGRAKFIAINTTTTRKRIVRITKTSWAVIVWTESEARTRISWKTNERNWIRIESSATNN